MWELLASVLAALAIVPLWHELRRGRVGWPVAAAATAGALAVVVTVAGGPEPGPPPPDARPLVEAHGGYVGSRTCRSCHPGEHASWHDSYHRTMTRVAGRDTVIADFDRLELDWFGEPVTLAWAAGRLWVEFERGGQRPAHVTAPVEQVTGSHHMQVLWYSTGRGRELAPVPLCYRIEEQRWLPITAVFLVPPELREPQEPGAWNENCHMCHATGVEPRLGAGRVDTRAAELGIACEACHGPGEEHVAANRDPLRRYALRADGGGDDTIVDPADLGAERSAQVCGQCHAVSILREEHHDTWPEEGLPYRPGEDLDETRRILDPAEPEVPELRRRLATDPDYFESSFWSDGTVRLAGREYNGLLETPCHTHGDEARRMTCLSCHDLHREGGQEPEAWREDQLRPGMRGNAACVQCHEDLAGPEALVAHTHHDAGSPGSNCYNCHMSFTTFGLMKALRSHTVTSPSVQAELDTGRPNACNQCHLDRTLAWTNRHLERDHGIAPVVLDEEQREVAASVRWALTGDAALRALAGWSMGWEAAREASGTGWMQPYLGRLLDDPYYAVRFQAQRSLRSLPEREGIDEVLRDYDFLAGEEAAGHAAEAVMGAWRADPAGAPEPGVLLGDDGFRWARFRELHARRDDSPVYLTR